MRPSVSLCLCLLAFGCTTPDNAYPIESDRPLNSVSGADELALCEWTQDLGSTMNDEFRKVVCHVLSARRDEPGEGFGKCEQGVIDCLAGDVSATGLCLVDPTTSGLVNCPGTVGDYYQCHEADVAAFIDLANRINCENAFDIYDAYLTGISGECNEIFQCLNPYFE